MNMVLFYFFSVKHLGEFGDYIQKKSSLVTYRSMIGWEFGK